MTDTEIQSWLSYHDARFPGFLAWTQKNVGDKAESRAWWQECFGRVELADAKAESDHAARDWEFPKGYGMHVRLIADRAARRSVRRRTPTIVDGDRSFVCRACKDTGIATIHWKPGYVPKKFAEVYGYERGGRFAQRCRHGVACDCEFGRKHTELTPLDRERMDFA